VDTEGADDEEDGLQKKTPRRGIRLKAGKQAAGDGSDKDLA
jgi:hypothetical protein